MADERTYHSVRTSEILFSIVQKRNAFILNLAENARNVSVKPLEQGVSVLTFGEVSEVNGWLKLNSTHKTRYRHKVCDTALHAYFNYMLDSDTKEHKRVREFINNRGWYIVPHSMKQFEHLYTFYPKTVTDVTRLYQVLCSKLALNKDLKDKLLETGDQYILCDSVPAFGEWRLFLSGYVIDGDIYGHNVLGKLWMFIREELVEMKQIELKFNK